MLLKAPFGRSDNLLQVQTLEEQHSMAGTACLTVSDVPTSTSGGKRFASGDDIHSFSRFRH